MATTVTEKTDKPTGLNIKRSGETFTLEWKIGDKDYGAGQWFDYMINDTGKDSWHQQADKISSVATKKSIKVDRDKFYPNKKADGSYKNYLYDIRMRVKGERKKYTTGSGSKKKTHNPKVSDWAKKEYEILKPKKPSVSVSLDNELSNKCTFSWTTEVKSDSQAWFTNTYYQTMLVKNCTEKKGENLNWKNASSFISTQNNSYVATEDTAVLYTNNDSYTRWFRICSRGPRGKSDWVYASHVYAIPNQTEMSTPIATPDGNGLIVDVSWEADANTQYPIDKTIVEYTFTKPDANLACPANATWTQADASADTKKSDRAVLSIDGQPDLDECLFVRVNTQHDSKITYGKPSVAKRGFLKDPTALSVSTDESTHRATVTCTNNSEVEDSKLAVIYVSQKETFVVGIIPHGQSSVVCQCPDWSNETTIAFRVKAFVGTYSKQTRADGVDTYRTTDLMWSEHQLAYGGVVPIAPANVSVSRFNDNGTVQVKWDWSWQAANGAQLSWADHEDAWESTDEPETYSISNMHAAQWNIHDLELGKTWYIRVRLFKGEGDTITYGPWSSIDAGTIDLSATPNKPVIQMSKPIITRGEKLTASWVYTSKDNTPQTNAQVALVTMNDTPAQTLAEADYVVYDEKSQTNVGYNIVRSYNTIARTETAQNVSINTASYTQGSTYNYAVRVQSQSGRWSEWSDIYSVTVANPITCTVTLSDDSFASQTDTVTAKNVDTGVETTETITYTKLYEMPLKVTVTGAGVGGQTTVVVERAKTYNLERPDGDVFTGYEGETVLQKTSDTEGLIVFDLDDRLGPIDDGAEYNLIATVQDKFGQQATSEPIPFTVRWTKQATKPTADFDVDRENLIVKITPHKSLQANLDDVFDIYRLSADKPELIVQNGAFGQTYVDPYPTLGEHGGHCVVLKTKNGDYIYENQTDGRGLAWYVTDDDDNDIIEFDKSVIDFNGDRVFLDHNVELSNKWEKDFQQTKYMGGSIQGDWTAGVKRSGTINTTMITLTDKEDILAMRRLADYSGICHVRTADGSSYSADVQVSQDIARATYGMLTSFSLTIHKIDPQELDGVLEAEWEEQGQDELE